MSRRHYILPGFPEVRTGRGTRGQAYNDAGNLALDYNPVTGKLWLKQGLDVVGGFSVDGLPISGSTASGTVDKALIHWDSGSGLWREVSAVKLADNGLMTFAPTADYYETITHADALGFAWNGTIASFANDPGPRKNVVIMWGFNVATGGAILVPGEPAMYFSMESHYQRESGNFFEWHQEFTRQDGVIDRVWSMIANKTQMNDANPLLRPFSYAMFQRYAGYDFYAPDSPNASYMAWDSGSLGNPAKMHLTNMVIARQVNNVPFLTQKNAAMDADVNIVKLDADDQVRIGDAYAKGGLRIEPGVITLPDSSSATPPALAAGESRSFTRGNFYYVAVNVGGTIYYNKLDPTAGTWTSSTSAP